MMKSRRMGWTGHEALMGKNRNLYRAFWKGQKERGH
jgi:hypothetical protein